MTFDIKKIKRRERRFYRVYVDGKINYLEENDKNQPVVIEKRIIIDKNKISKTDKQNLIDAILLDLNKRINPDIDEISDIIYLQMSNNSIVTSQKTVKKVIEKNNIKSSSNLTDRQKLERVIDDIVEENIKVNTREKEKNKIIDEKEIVVKKKIIVTKKEKTKKKSEPKKKEEKKPEPKKKEEKKPEPKKKEEFKLDFGDNFTIDIGDDEDGLGLKF